MFSFMIMFVTGIPVNERLMMEEHGDKYKEYQNRVPVFFPNPFTAPSKLTQKGEPSSSEKQNIKQNIPNMPQGQERSEKIY